MNAANALAYLAQITIVVLICAGLPRLLGLRSPGIQYAYWRMVLLVCVMLPIVQPWRPAEMAFVPAPGPPPAFMSSAPPPAPAPVTNARAFDWFTAVQTAAVAGIALRLSWLALGAIRLRRLRRGATDPALGFDDLKSAIGAAPPILWSGAVRHPVTFGVFRPVVLLPAAIKAIDLPAQRAIVAHELHHVRRRDWSWVVAEEVVRSVFWFHPAMWWLVSRVQLARETVVDELSILTTNARRTYLDTLLAFADDTGLASSPAFSARRHLFHRVMLLSKEGGMSSIRIAITSCALLVALAAGSWTAVNAFPLYGAVAQDQAPPRDPVKPKAPPAAADPSQNASSIPAMTEEFKQLIEQLEPVRIGGQIEPPKKVRDVKPVYPVTAQVERVEGVVIVEAVIDITGRIAGTRVLKSIPLLDDAALEAVRQWQFEPALVDGLPRAVMMTTTVNFRLQ